MAEVTFTDKNFEAEVINSDVPVLVDFWAPWCGPCQMMGPIIEQLAEEFESKIKIGKLDVDENPETAEQYDVMSIPVLMFFKDGKNVEQLTGAQSKDVLEKKIKEIIS
jgi:thioredoxin 1